MTDTSGFLLYVPSRRERFWRWAGFSFHLGSDEGRPDNAQGWFQARTTMHLDWRDRLRILVSGRLNVQHTFHLDTPSPDKIHTRFDWHILPPGEKF